MKRGSIVGCTVMLAVGFGLGCVFADGEEGEPSPATPGDRLRALWTAEGWQRLQSQVSDLSGGWWFESRWRKFIREQFGVTWVSLWKADEAVAIGKGMLRRHPDGVEFLMRNAEGRRERLSDAPFDCFVVDGEEVRRAVPDDPVARSDVAILVLVPDRIIQIEPDGRIRIEPRRPAMAR